MRTILVAIALVGSAGCLRKTLYKCSDSSQCGADGQCESAGFCSFPDPNCTLSGRRYGEYSSEQYANQCVGTEQQQNDGGIDTMTSDAIDAMPDTMTGSCPGTYTTTIGTHKYRVIGGNATWDAQKTDCGNDAASGTYLAIPDDQTELDAIVAASNKALTWVGINDPADNNMFVTVKSVAFSSTSALWGSGEPDNQPTGGPNNGNCVQAASATNRLDDEDCAKTRPAVCECEP